MTISNLLVGYKTYAAAIGLIGLAAYQVSQHQDDQAAQSRCGALAAVGIHSAILKSSQ